MRKKVGHLFCGFCFHSLPRPLQRRLKLGKPAYNEARLWLEQLERAMSVAVQWAA